jgi:hypothetical protein
LDSRTKRRLKLADFPMQAAVKDLDFSPERGLERRLILELSQCNWVDQALNILVSGATGTGKSFVACSLDTAAICLGYSVRYFRTARFLLTLTRACQEGSYLNLLRSLSRTDVSRMIGCGIPFLCRLLRICWKFSTIASENPQRSLMPKSPSLPGMPDSQTLLWRTLFWIVRSTMPINFLYSAIPKESYVRPAPCHT